MRFFVMLIIAMYLPVFLIGQEFQSYTSNKIGYIVDSATDRNEMVYNYAFSIQMFSHLVAKNKITNIYYSNYTTVVSHQYSWLTNYYGLDKSSQVKILIKNMDTFDSKSAKNNKVNVAANKIVK